MLKSHFTSNRNYSQHSRVTTILNIVEYTVEICTPPLFFRQTYPSSTVCARLIFRVPFRGEERFLACTSYLTSKDSFSFIVDKPLSMGSQQPVSLIQLHQLVGCSVSCALRSVDRSAFCLVFEIPSWADARQAAFGRLCSAFIILRSADVFEIRRLFGNLRDLFGRRTDFSSVDC